MTAGECGLTVDLRTGEEIFSATAFKKKGSLAALQSDSSAIVILDLKAGAAYCGCENIAVIFTVYIQCRPFCVILTQRLYLKKGFAVKKIAVKFSADLIFSVRGAIMKSKGQREESENRSQCHT